jgi:hypothetical protein
MGSGDHPCLITGDLLLIDNVRIFSTFNLFPELGGIIYSLP